MITSVIHDHRRLNRLARWCTGSNRKVKWTAPTAERGRHHLCDDLILPNHITGTLTLEIITIRNLIDSLNVGETCLLYLHVELTTSVSVMRFQTLLILSSTKRVVEAEREVSFVSLYKRNISCHISPNFAQRKYAAKSTASLAVEHLRDRKGTFVHGWFILRWYGEKFLKKLDKVQSLFFKKIVGFGIRETPLPVRLQQSGSLRGR